MSKSLVIVESPKKSVTIGKYLESWRPKTFKVASSVGHVIDLPEKELGVDVDHDFQPTYVPAPRKGKVISELKKLARQADTILLATDQDREGEAIAWHLANLLSEAARKQVTVQRVRFNEITKDAIIEAFSHPDSINQNLVDAQQARRIMDRLVGYKVSPLLWKTISRGLSAGRVQSVAVRLVCEREEEIAAFVPQEYWSFTGTFRSHADETFEAQLHHIDGKKPKVESTEAANTLKAEMVALAEQYRVRSIGEKDVQRKPSAPFITSTLQQDAARRLGFSPKKTMMLAQQLYEGVELEKGENTGLITYMRTDSTRLSQTALDECRDWITKKLGEDFLPKNPVQYKGRKSAQDAHEAIRPTSFELEPERLNAWLTKDQKRLYELIWRRALASQVVPAMYRQRTIDTAAGRFVFRTSGRVLVHEGFLKVYADPKAKTTTGDTGNEWESGGRFIPTRIQEGEEAHLKKLDPKQHFTKPPARYTQESLIRMLEELGIGRPSTYASIVDMILSRNYVEIKEKRFYPTDLGKTVTRILVDNFAGIFNVDFTARMETDLDNVEQGRNWTHVLQEFYDPFQDALKIAEENRGKIKESITEKAGEKCPECGEELIYKWGRHGRFIACTSFPTCKYTRNLEDENLPEIDVTCELCGKPMQIKTSRYGKFLGCSGYPDCRNTKAMTTGVRCPKPDCDGEISERRTRRGRVFYGCTKYPNCDFASWDKPVAKACSHCNNNYLVEKRTESKGDFLRCPICKSEFQLEASEDKD